MISQESALKALGGERDIFYDLATGLPGRALFNEVLSETLLSLEPDCHLAVMVIDLDGFKQINDAYGHNFGDRVLQEFSKILEGLFSSALVSRFGDDEFGVLIPFIKGTRQEAMFTCGHAIQILYESLSSGLLIHTERVHVLASTGITLVKEGSAGQVVAQASIAMSKAKEGRNTFCFYKESIESVSDKLSTVNDLRLSLVSKEGFSVVYQPQFNSKMEIAGVEALVRWNSPNGPISPVDFIPLAEETGLINELGMLVVEEVLGDIVRLGSYNKNCSLRAVSINLSIKQLANPNLFARLMGLFSKYQVPPSKVRFEFTESVFLEAFEDAKKLFAEMSKEGFTFSLDDFGTGFSSLSYLKTLPISELKIDKSFIDGITVNESDATICNATIGMAKKLGLEVVAEGVEHQEQFDWLVSEGCDLMQGYLMSKPVSFDEFRGLLLANRDIISSY